MEQTNKHTYVTKDEMACRCGCDLPVNNNFLQKLNDARHKAGIPFNISSGVRCSTHNEKIGGKRDSSHIIGQAADITVSSSRDRWIILQALLQVGFNRIGIADSFIHVDDDINKSQKVIWTY